LSAGTGVGIWAIESIKPPFKINNFVMLGSSLSSRYDTRKALSNLKGRIYVYHSSTDPVLAGPVRVLGTIDGTFDDSAGLVGLRGAGRASGRIVNIGRTARHARDGWTGGHADCTNRRFVRKYLAQHIVSAASKREASLVKRGASLVKREASERRRDTLHEGRRGARPCGVAVKRGTNPCARG
jgi:hypothetical protein